jgi:hypothetical protein
VLEELGNLVSALICTPSVDQLETDVGLQLGAQALGCRLQICLVATYRFGNAGHLLWNPASPKQRASRDVSNRMATAPPTTDGDSR